MSFSFEIFFIYVRVINLVVVLHQNIVKELYDKVNVKLEDVLMVYVARNMVSVEIRLNIVIKHQKVMAIVRLKVVHLDNVVVYMDCKENLSKMMKIIHFSPYILAVERHLNIVVILICQEVKEIANKQAVHQVSVVPDLDCKRKFLLYIDRFLLIFLL